MPTAAAHPDWSAGVGPRGVAVLLAVLLVVLGGCTAGDPRASQSRSPGPTGSPRPAPAGSPTSNERVRGCAESTTLDLPAGGPNSTAAGPARFTALDIQFGRPDQATSSPDASGWIPLKIALFVHAGTRLTVTIPAEYRRTARLLYLAGADTATTFESCPATSGAAETGFPGGLAIAGPMCLPVDVAWDGQTARLTLALFKDGC